MNGFVILSSNLPYRPLLKNKNKIILTLPVVSPCKESLIQEMRQIF